MSINSITFPPLVEFNDYRNYDTYEDALLEIYERDLWKGGLTFRGLKVIPRVHQKFEKKGKTLDWTFVHFTSMGQVEVDRELDLNRCARIGWVKPIIENCHLPCVKVWENDRIHQGKTTTSIVFWCEDVNAKVVITMKEGNRDKYYYTITTFYLVNRPDKVKSLNEEYERYVKNNGEYPLTNIN